MPAVSLAQTVGGLDEFAAVTRLGIGTDLISMTARIINIVLSVLGVIAVGIVLYGGWLWLMSRGNEEQIAKAKKVIANGLIGLIIILTSFAIASFVLTKLAEATGADLGGGGPGCVGVGCLPEGGEKGFNVVSTSPRHLATNVKLCQDVMATFNQEVDAGSVDDSSFIIEKQGGSQVLGTYATATNAATFSHATDFEENTDYKATVTQDVQNFAGKTLEKRKEWLFQTGTESDSTLPRVAVDADSNPLVYPSAGLGDVCRNPAIQAIFTEEMRVSRFNTDNIILTDSGGNVIPLKKIYAGSDFTSFTVYPAATLTSNETFTVTLKTDGTGHPGGITDTCSNPLDGNEDGSANDSPADDYTWTFTTGENANCNPEISSVTPNMGDYADQVTITGRNLGITGDASFNGWWADANSFLPLTDNIICWGAAACATVEDTVKVKIPVGATTGAWYQQDKYKAASGRVWLALATAVTNKLDFVIKSPYINRLSPETGGVGQFVTLMGWNFGNVPGRVTLNGVDIGPPASCSNWWKDTRIIVQVPTVATGYYDFQVITAADAASSNPQVAENKNKRSNYELFQVTSDSPGPGICDIDPEFKLDTDPPISVTVTGEHFGATKGSSQLLFGAANSSPTSWSDGVIITNTPTLTVGEHDVCATVNSKTSNCVLFTVEDTSGLGGSSRPPEVVRSNICTETTQSPNPYINSTNACTNALVSARFTEIMQDSTLTDSNIQLYQCSDEATLDSSTCTSPITLGAFTMLKNSSDATEGFTATPAIEFQNNYWYKGLIKKDAASAAGVTMVADYPWYFRASGGNCALNKVMLQPGSANLAGVGSTQGFLAAPTALNCNILDATGLSWTWDRGNDADDPDPIPHIDFTTITGSSATIEGQSITINGPSWVTAETEGKVSKQAPVTVGDTGAIIPSGPPVITGMDPTDGRAQAGVTTAVTIYGRNFGSSGSVYFGSVQASPATCGSWSDTQIIIAAPPLSLNVSYAVRVETKLGSSVDATDADAVQPNFLSNNVVRPGICSMTPDFGPGGTNVSIKGYNFTDSASAGQINFPIYDSSGSVSTANPTPTSWNNTTIRFSVPGSPDLPRTADVNVTVDYGAAGGGSKTSNGILFYGEPFITSITPSTGPAGSGVTIRGGNFGPSVGTVTFNGVNSESLPPQCLVTTWTNTQIVAKAPSAGSTGLVKVKTATPPGLQTTDARSKTFTYDASQPLAPLLCNLSQASVGSPPFPAIDLLGDLFGSKGLTDQVNFTNQVFISLITHLTIWTNELISTRPLPDETESGDVTVQKDVTITVKKCSGVLVGSICLGSWTDVNESHRVVSNPLAFTVGVGPGGPVGNLLVTGFIPADASGGNCRNTLIAADFNKLVEPNSVSSDDVKLYKIIIGTPATEVAGQLRLTNNGGTSRLSFVPNEPLAAGTIYSFNVGTNLTGRDGSTLDCSGGCFNTFTTGADICQINKVTITPAERLFTALDQTQDFLAEALAPDGNPLTVAFTWAEVDAADVIESAPLDENNEVTPHNKNGRASLEVTADGSALGAGIKKASAAVDVWLCEDPYLFESADYNFSFRYCKQKTAGDPRLPNLLGPTVPIGPPVADATLLPPELLFNIAGTEDVIGVRAYRNADYLAPAEWLKQKQGSTVTLNNTQIDGYAAATGGQTVYVSSLNVTTGRDVYSNELLLSLNQQAGPAARQIFEELVNSWQFNTNLVTEDDQQKLQADFKRLMDLKSIRDSLDRYAVLHDYTVPLLPSGSYIPALSTSKWNSWQQTLAAALGKTLPVDPINSFGACAGHDPATCWDEVTKDFTCPADSYIYRYRALSSQIARLYFNPEFTTVFGGSGITWKGSPEITVPGPADNADECSDTNPIVWQEVDYANPVLSVAPPDNGVVRSDDSKINCGAACNANYASVKKCSATAAANAGGACLTDADCGSTSGACQDTASQVTLTATPQAGYKFTGWSGCDVPGTTECHVKMDVSKDVSAGFSAVTYTLTLNKEGDGTVTLTNMANGSAINCTANCTASYSGGPTVRLTAAPASGFVFAGWGGSCTGTGSCQVVMGSNKTVGAKFIPTHRLRVVPSGPGTVVSNPAGLISCGADCTEDIPEGTSVTLIPVAGVKAAFTGWGGDCTGAGSCTVVLDGDKTITAAFETVIIKYNLDVTRGGTGTGLVTSSDGFINCGSDCSETYDEDKLIILTASPGVGSDFDGWVVNGSETFCPAASSTCSLTFDRHYIIQAKFKPKIFNVSITKGGAGTGTVASDPAGINCGGTCQYNFVYGQTVVLTPTPVPPDEFTTWGGEVACGGAGTCTIVVTSNLNITARFDKTFELEVKNNGGSGLGTVVSNPKGLNGVAINCGGDCKDRFISGAQIDTNGDGTNDASTVLTATAASGSAFAGWSGGGCGGTGDCNLLSTNGVVVTAIFNVVPLTYQLNVTTSGSGNVKSSPSGIDCGNGGSTCGASFANGAPVTLLPTAAAGSSFTNWTGNCSGSGSCNVTMDGLKNVGAVFTADEHTVTVIIVNPGGTVTSDVGGINCPGTCSDNYDYGASVTLTAIPQAGYTFSGWSVGCSGTGQCNLTMGSTDITVYATFSPIIYFLTVSKVISSGTGTVVSDIGGINLVCTPGCSSSSYPYSSGQTVTLTATPTGGSGIAGWVGDCAAIPAFNKCVVTMTSAKNVQINFSPPPPPVYTVTINPAPSGGTVTGTSINCPGDCTGSFDSGTPVTLTANNNATYAFKRWVGDECNSSTNSNCTFNISGNKTLTAEFAPIRQLKITIAGGSGSVTTNPAGTSCGVNCYEFVDGQAVTLTALAASGYAFKNWTLDAASCGNTNPCIITMTTNKTVTAEFMVASSTCYNLQTLVGPVSGAGVVNRDLSNSPDCLVGKYTAGTTIQLTAAANAGYEFDKWTGNASGSLNPLSFSMPASNAVIAAIFKTPAPLTYTYHMYDQFNVISLPFNVADSTWNVLFPTAVQRPWKLEGSYVTVDNIEPGYAYMIKFNGEQDVTITGTSPVDSYSYSASGGWWGVGSLSTTVSISKLTSSPGAITQIAYWDGAASPQGWVTSGITDIIRGVGYWLKTNLLSSETTTITLTK